MDENEIYDTVRENYLKANRKYMDYQKREAEMRAECLQKNKDENVLSPSELSRRIRQYRIVSGITVEELSEKTGLSIEEITEMEKGRDVQISTLAKALDGLGIDRKIESLVPDIRLSKK